MTLPKIMQKNEQSSSNTRIEVRSDKWSSKTNSSAEVNRDPCAKRKKGHRIRKNEPPRTDFEGKMIYMSMGGANYIPYTLP